MSEAVAHTVMVPGLPHLLARQGPPAWHELRDAVERLGAEIRDEVDAWLLVSTSWFTVLGFQFQLDPRPRGLRIDENWYAFDFGEIPYDFRVDLPLTEAWAQLTEDEGSDVHRTDYEGFPIDTGTVTALALLDPDHRLPVATASINLYADADLMGALGRTARDAAAKTGRRVAVVAVSGLSSGLHQEWDIGDDRIHSGEHDRWNQKVLGLLARGELSEALARREDYAAAAAVDSQFRALTFLAGTGTVDGPADVLAYGPIWGTGAAVVHWRAPRSATARTATAATEGDAS